MEVNIVREDEMISNDDIIIEWELNFESSFNTLSLKD
jgi:hypothetical protein